MIQVATIFKTFPLL